jgi:hypothetical protein
MLQRLTVLVAACLALVAADPATASTAAQHRHLAAIDRMMAALAAQSARDAATIRATYRDHLDLLMLHQYASLEEALGTGGLVPLPPDPVQFNIAPRLEGAHPIGEKDLERQVSYLTARPATMGALLDVASRVTSGPIEITSLVRHGEYQESLRTTNVNATTSVPMHTMGLAFDIALVNTPLRTIYELRAVLQRMRDAGEILFIGERRQLVFHVVPHPSRLGHFAEVYDRAKSTPEWWAAENVATDLTVEVLASLTAPTPAPAPVPQRAQEPEPATLAGALAARLRAFFDSLTVLLV